MTPAQLRTAIAILDARGDVLRARLALAECRPERRGSLERVLAEHRARLAGMIEAAKSGEGAGE